MLSFLKGIVGWKLYGLIAVGALSAGFYAGTRWEKGAQLNDAQRALQELSEQAQAALVSLGKSWEDEVDKTKIKVEEWNLQSQVDEVIFLEIRDGQNDIRSRFDELDNEITVVTEFGTCELSDSAVRLLREASERTRAAELPTD